MCTHALSRTCKHTTGDIRCSARVCQTRRDETMQCAHLRGPKLLGLPRSELQRRARAHRIVTASRVGWATPVPVPIWQGGGAAADHARADAEAVHARLDHLPIAAAGPAGLFIGQRRAFEPSQALHGTAHCGLSHQVGMRSAARRRRRLLLRREPRQEELDGRGACAWLPLRPQRPFAFASMPFHPSLRRAAMRHSGVTGAKAGTEGWQCASVMGSTGHVGDGAKMTHGEKLWHANASAASAAMPRCDAHGRRRPSESSPGA